MVDVRMPENGLNFYIVYKCFLVIYFLCESHVVKIYTHVHMQPQPES